MRVPLSWLKDFVDITEDIQTLCKKMVDIGLEIEEVDYLGKNVSNIVVCQIGLSTSNADNISGTIEPKANQIDTRSVVMISSITATTIIDNQIQNIVLISFPPLII